jgi:hypothetical protein
MSRIDSLTQIRVRLTYVTTQVSPTSLERIRQAWAGVPMWQRIKKKKRTLDGCRIDAIRNFLIRLDQHAVVMADNDDVIPACTDESHLHNNNSLGMSHCANKELMGKSASEGKRLVIPHAMTPNGPLCERDPVTKVPQDDLIWKGDVPHPKAFHKRTGDEQSTCELLWVSSSSTGDCHDNMNSEMHMKWIVEKLVSTFERLHPGKKMLLTQDNTPHHHKRGIPSLASLTKKLLPDLAIEHDVEHVNLPMSVERRTGMEGTDMGEFLRVDVDVDTMGGVAGRNRPHAPNVSELRLGLIKHFQEHKPELLECLVEKHHKDRGHGVLWTPPCCSDLQPIKRFWAAGKNHAAWMHFDGCKMKDAVSHLRAGWHGNEPLFADLGRASVKRDCVDGNENHPHKKGADCQKLWLAMLKKASQVFIPMCPGLSGTIGTLVDGGLHEPQAINIPVDAFLNLNAGLHLEGVADEDSEVVDPFGGELLDGCMWPVTQSEPGIHHHDPCIEMLLIKFSIFQWSTIAS